MFWFHWSFIIVIPGIIMGIWAQAKVKSTFKKFSQVRSMRGLTGAQAARQVLDSSGLSQVAIERVAGNLTDHYDPRSKVLRLSEGVYNSASLAAVGVAAHEAGHAVQDAKGYAPFNIRSALVPVANLGSGLLMPLIFAGFIFQAPMLIKIGAIVYSLAVLFHLVTLPVELNASSRALALISDNGILAQDEIGGARKVLTAAAMTYVAALVVSLLYLLQLLIMSRD